MATSSAIPLHSVSLIRSLIAPLHSAESFSLSFHFIPAVFCSCRHLLIWRLLSGTAITVWLRYHFALNQGLPMAVLKCNRAVSRSQYYSSLRYATLRSRPAVAVPLPQPRPSLLVHSKSFLRVLAFNAFFRSLWYLGVFDCLPFTKYV